MNSLAQLIGMVVNIYIWMLIASAVLSWLVSFNVVNTRNRFVYMAGDFLYRVTEPALRPLRRVIPNLGGIDITPVILIVLLIFAKNLIFEYLF
jgi:YggT family protein